MFNYLQNQIFHESQRIFLSRSPAVKQEQADGVVNYLPDIILLEIFKHLNLRDLGVAAGVCKRWYGLTHDPILRRTLDATFVRLTGLQIWRLLHLQALSCVREVHLLGQFTCNGYHQGSYVTSCHSISPSLSSFTLPELRTRCPSLHSLFLSDMCLAFDTNGSVVTLQDFPDSLRRLGVRSSLVHTQRFFTDDPEQVLPDLVFLDLGLCNIIGTGALKRLGSWSTSLRALGLERCTRIGNDSLEQIPQLLGALSVLDLEGTEVGEEGFESVLKVARNLQHLFLGLTHFTGESLYHVAKGSLSRLRRICLRSTRVTTDAVLRMVDVAPKLEVILLSRGTPVDSGLGSRLPPRCNAVWSTVEATETCGHFLSDTVRQVKVS